MAALSVAELNRRADRDRIHAVLYHLCQSHAIPYRYGKAKSLKPLTVLAVNKAGGADQRDMACLLNAGRLGVSDVGKFRTELAAYDEAFRWLARRPTIWCVGGEWRFAEWQARKQLGSM
jgi:hypothetical protein